MIQKPKLKSLLLENLSYKIVAFFIAIILWLTIMGRRDLILTKNFGIEFKTAVTYEVQGQTADQIRVRLSGPRSALREVMEAGTPKPIQIDLSDRVEGLYDIDVPIHRIDLPQGVRVLSIRPNLVRVEVVKVP